MTTTPSAPPKAASWGSQTPPEAVAAAEAASTHPETPQKCIPIPAVGWWHRVTPKKGRGGRKEVVWGGGWSCSPPPAHYLPHKLSDHTGNALIKEQGFSLSFPLLSRASCANPAPGKVTLENVKLIQRAGIYWETIFKRTENNKKYLKKKPTKKPSSRCLLFKKIIYFNDRY